MNGQELLNGDEYTTHRLKRLGDIILALRTKLLENPAQDYKRVNVTLETWLPVALFKGAKARDLRFLFFSSIWHTLSICSKLKLFSAS